MLVQNLKQHCYCCHSRYLHWKVIKQEWSCVHLQVYIKEEAVITEGKATLSYTTSESKKLNSPQIYHLKPALHNEKFLFLVNVDSYVQYCMQ